MDEKLKKALKTSKQGIGLVLILSIIANVLVAINSKSVLWYFKNSWVSLIYMIGLVVGLIMYKKEKYTQGSEIIQWTALGNIIVQFINFVTYYVLTKLVVLIVISFVIGMVIPVILIVESLKVLRLSEEQKRSNKTTIIALIIIVVICVLQVLSIYIPMKQLSSITSSSSENESDEQEEINNAEPNLEKRTLIEGDKYTLDEYRYSNGSLRIIEDMIKSIQWATEEAYNKESGLKVYIKNNKVYYEHDGKTQQIKSIKGKAINVTETIGGGTMVLQVLSDDGKVWIAFPLEAENVDSFEEVESLKLYNIKRLATLHFEEITDLIYYETSDGKLIDYDGFTIKEKRQYLLDRYGVDVCLEIGANGKLGYFNGDQYAANYKSIITSNGDSINAKRIYTYVKGDGIIRYIVVTTADQLYEIQLGNTGTEIVPEVVELSQDNTVSNVVCYAENNRYTAEFTMSDNTTIIKEIGDIEGYCDYYNVETNETIELK